MLQRLLTELRDVSLVETSNLFYPLFQILTSVSTRT